MTDRYYQTIAKRLREYMERERITVSTMAKQVDEQYNTVKGILEGRRFQAHHVVWLSRLININYEKGDSGDEKEKEGKLSTFI